MLDIICSLQKNATTEALVWKCFQKKKLFWKARENYQKSNCSGVRVATSIWIPGIPGIVLEFFLYLKFSWKIGIDGKWTWMVHLQSLFNNFICYLELLVIIFMLFPSIIKVMLPNFASNLRTLFSFSSVVILVQWF